MFLATSRVLSLSTHRTYQDYWNIRYTPVIVTPAFLANPFSSTILSRTVQPGPKMGWWCCYCEQGGMWSFMTPICLACGVHRRCHTCRMTTDSRTPFPPNQHSTTTPKLTTHPPLFPGIDEQRYRIPLKPQWEAEETYNFMRYHVRGCDQEKCNGACGQKDKKKLRQDIKMRRDVVKERRKNASESTTDGKEEPKTPPMTGRTEEPGDEAFVISGKGKGKGKGKAKEEGSATKGQKKVKFAT
ncbi:MAG: hypothetical protein Q9216_005004 [Gyalolechia sp. 2 TL-2023]